MVVQKFGGTSVADPEAIRRLIEIVRAARTRDARGPVRKYADRLVVDLGENLRSIAVFGSATGPDYVPGRSDVNLLIGVRVRSFEKLCPSLYAEVARHRAEPTDRPGHVRGHPDRRGCLVRLLQ